MIGAIIWKEWKRSRKILLIFLGASILLPAWPAAYFPNEGETARAFLFFIWLIFSFIIGFRYERMRRGGHSYLSTRPATSPFLFVTHVFIYLMMIGALVVVSLSVHYLQLSANFQDISPSDILLDENFLFALLWCMFFFTFSTFVSTSLATFGFSRMGLAFLLLTPVLYLFRNYFSPFFSFLQEGFREEPVLLLSALMAFTVFFAAVSLWEVSFDEIRDSRNRRWLSAVVISSVIGTIIPVDAGVLFARSFPDDSNLKFAEVRVTGIRPYPILASLSGQRQETACAITADSHRMADGKFKRASRSNPVDHMILPVHGKGFITIYNPLFEKAFAFSHSENPLLGERIWMCDYRNGSVHDLSPGRLLSKQQLSLPFLSPDKDRFAYLLSHESNPGTISQSLYVVKYNSYYPLSDKFKLPKDPGAVFVPIGWTPDGYDFMLQRKDTDGEQIWAVDWNAQNLRPFLPEFGSAVITEDDLAEAGEWISLLMSEGDKRILWLVNYRSGEKVRIGAFEDIPLRAWSDSGDWFSLWSREKGLTIYHVTDKVLDYTDFRAVSAPEQMKWSPNGSFLAFVTPDAEDAEVRNLCLLNRINCRSRILLENFPSTEKLWDWLSPAAIVYSDGEELWQVDLLGEKTFLTSAEFLGKN